MKVVLIGFACSYKTSVGRLLANKLNVQHIDVDNLVEERSGQTVAEIFAIGGECAFRTKEEQALLSLTDCDDAVISCGGGAPLHSSFNQLAETSAVVWLTATAATVKQRLGGTIRPLFDGKTTEQLDEMINNRAAYYAKYANVTIATDGKTSEQVADEVVFILNG